MRDYIQYSHVGVLFAAVFGLFVYGGIQLDKKMDMQPLFTLLGVILGFVMACYKLIKETEVKKK
ncbi:AtpZ/AtpI family protein [Candidatus Uabimicrobium sp. HlEnr_7]|uniref:AtpZ/AtpI family protein n=1 Tax=Candidatus Uabimicrobium helgolandensis TaxID=3095367 RepID=UPI003556F54A